MRILILGGNGMIGHKMYQIISKYYQDTWVTLRNNLSSYSYSEIYNSEKVIDKIDLSDFKLLLNQFIGKMLFEIELAFIVVGFFTSLYFSMKSFHC